MVLNNGCLLSGSSVGHLLTREAFRQQAGPLAPLWRRRQRDQIDNFSFFFQGFYKSFKTIPSIMLDSLTTLEKWFILFLKMCLFQAKLKKKKRDWINESIRRLLSRQRRIKEPTPSWSLTRKTPTNAHWTWVAKVCLFLASLTVPLLTFTALQVIIWKTICGNLVCLHESKARPQTLWNGLLLKPKSS